MQRTLPNIRFSGSVSGLVVIFLAVLLFSAKAPAQQPFITDDADTTEKNKFHFEAINELDGLPPSSFPVNYQDGFRMTIAYGLVRNVEVSLTTQYLLLVREPGSGSRFTAGLGETTLGVKYNFFHERKSSRLPALAFSGYVQFPTGSVSRGLGSGVTDYGFYAVAQKTLGEKNVLRVNAGFVASGNTITGALGIATVRGGVFPGSVSLVRKISEKLQLGLEVSGAVTNQFQLSSGQLQAQLGGNYQVSKKTSFDFGIVAGRFAASPRYGLQLGFSHDF